MILGYNSGGPIPGDPPEPAMLVCSKFGGSMERTGLDWVGYRWCNRYDRDGVEDSQGYDISIEALMSGARISPINDVPKEPPQLVKSWEEIQLG